MQDGVPQVSLRLHTGLHTSGATRNSATGRKSHCRRSFPDRDVSAPPVNIPCPYPRPHTLNDEIEGSGVGAGKKEWSRDSPVQKSESQRRQTVKRRKRQSQ